LKDIPGGEEGTRQRHRAAKAHHSKNLLLLNVHGVPGLGRPGEKQTRVCRCVGRLREVCSAMH